MTEQSQHAGPTHRAVEIGVAAVMAAFALVTIVGSLQAGINWGAEGPKAGFFPFYVGLIILISSVVNLAQVWSTTKGDQLFAEWGQLGKVMSVVVPTTIYVALITTIGIYVSSALLIALFMIWLGRYGWKLVLPISVGVPLAVFAIFEKWFLVPLPKGPIEEWLGF